MKEKKPNQLLQNIFDIRKEKKITLVELGKVLGVGESGASSIENGDVYLKAEHIPVIAKLLKVKEWELFIKKKNRKVDPSDELGKELFKLWTKIDIEGRRVILDMARRLSKK